MSGRYDELIGTRTSLLSLGQQIRALYVIGGLLDGPTLFYNFSLVPILDMDHAILLSVHHFCHSLVGIRVTSLVTLELGI
jgi:hypothetical protein